jgi:flagellar basal body rod protein FlgC
MDFFLPFQTRSSGRAVECDKGDIVTNSVANVNATSNPARAVYKRRSVVLAAWSAEADFDRPLQEVLLSTILREAK